MLLGLARSLALVDEARAEAAGADHTGAPCPLVACPAVLGWELTDLAYEVGIVAHGAFSSLDGCGPVPGEYGAAWGR